MAWGRAKAVLIHVRNQILAVDGHAVAILGARLQARNLGLVLVKRGGKLGIGGLKSAHGSLRRERAAITGGGRDRSKTGLLSGPEQRYLVGLYVL